MSAKLRGGQLTNGIRQKSKELKALLGVGMLVAVLAAV